MKQWVERPLGSVATLQRGFDLPHRVRQPGNVPIVTSAGLGGVHNKAMVEAPGVVTGRYGTIGKVFFLDQDFWPLNTTLWVSNFHGNDERFIYYLLQRVDYATHSGKSGVPGVNRNDLHTETVLLPPDTAEQRKIATAISTIDQLIASLKQLITKKREIKQGLMQELLSGRTRLPGFDEEWSAKRLGSVGSTYGGLVGKSATDFGHGGGRFVTFVEVMRDARMHGVDLAKVVIKPGELQNPVRSGDLLFNGSSETSEEVALASVVVLDEPNVFLNSFCFGYRISVDRAIDPLFLAYYFRAAPGRNLVASLAQGSTRYNIAKSKLLQSNMILPGFEEQQAIAAVVRDSDDEIAILERRLVSVRAIKQGMMQELLTGRTRLTAEAAP